MRTAKADNRFIVPSETGFSISYGLPATGNLFCKKIDRSYVKNIPFMTPPIDIEKWVVYKGDVSEKKLASSFRLWYYVLAT